jgi:hypothetical protein
VSDSEVSGVPHGLIEVPAPPRLHWAWVLLLSFVTLGLFWCAWLIIQAAWTRRVRAKGTAVWFAIFYLVIFSTRLLLEMTSYALVPYQLVPAVADAGGALNLLGYVAAVSMLWFEMKERPISLWLSGWGTYLLGPIYFQYSLNQAKNVKETAHASVPTSGR